MSIPTTPTPTLDPVREAIEPWTADEVAERVAAWWAPRAFQRFAEMVRLAYREAPDMAKRVGLKRLARGLHAASPEVMTRLSAEPAFARWAEGTRRALEANVGGEREKVPALLALAPRFHVALAMETGADLDIQVMLGSGGRARVPIDGRVLQGPAGRPVKVSVRGGELMTHGKKPRVLGGFEIIDGDAEGGRLPRLQPMAAGDAHAAGRRVEKAAKVLSRHSTDFHEEILALAPTLVTCRGDEDVSHSATLQFVRGCIWMSAPDRPMVIAETLVHETTHLKYHLLEDALPLTDPNDTEPRFHVPWRPDARPLVAVLMGLHAWVRVLRWLRTLEGTNVSQPAAERIPILTAATRKVAEALEGATGMTPAGQAVCSALAASIDP